MIGGLNYVIIVMVILQIICKILHALIKRSIYQPFMKIFLPSALSTEKAPNRQQIFFLSSDHNVSLPKFSMVRHNNYQLFAKAVKTMMLVGLLFGFSTIASAQQKLKDGSVSGSSLPNKDALLELESNVKGLLHARVALTRTTDAAPLTVHVAGMILINLTLEKMLQLS